MRAQTSSSQVKPDLAQAQNKARLIQTNVAAFIALLAAGRASAHDGQVTGRPSDFDPFGLAAAQALDADSLVPEAPDAVALSCAAEGPLSGALTDIALPGSEVTQGCVEADEFTAPGLATAQSSAQPVAAYTPGLGAPALLFGSASAGVALNETSASAPWPAASIWETSPNAEIELAGLMDDGIALPLELLTSMGGGGTFAVGSNGQAGTPPPAAAGFVDGQIIVKLSAGVGSEAGAALAARFGAKVGMDAQVFGIQMWQLPKGLSVENALRMLNANPLIELAEPNFEITVNFTPPNDPYFFNQWALHNTGQTYATSRKTAIKGKEDADIDAPEGWALQTSAGKIIVAVIDTGIDYRHPDLAANMWINPTTEGHRHGNNFFSSTSVDPWDDNGHGTHVAGTIGAVGNNGIGVTGVAWNVQLMALKFLGPNGSGSTSGAIEALNFAVKHGAMISNNSWGGGSFSSILEAAIKAAGEKGHLFIAAAGNSGSSSPSYPAAYNLANILSVAATDDKDGLASFSNYGSTVHLAAPGVNILSTVPNDGYGFKSGTSMAAPHVSGVAALVWALNPDLTLAEVRQLILDTADILASLNGFVTTGGRLNLHEALLEAAKSLTEDPVIDPVDDPLPDAPEEPVEPAWAYLYGADANSTVSGLEGTNNVIFGIAENSTRLGTGTIDILIGNDGIDIFMLGDDRGIFYDDGIARNAGRNDHAIIRNFTAEDDFIHLAANSRGYEVTQNGVNAEIYAIPSGRNHAKELIAIVENSTKAVVESKLIYTLDGVISSSDYLDSSSYIF
jgi:hypothetical protein